MLYDIFLVLDVLSSYQNATFINSGSPSLHYLGVRWRLRACLQFKRVRMQMGLGFAVTLSIQSGSLEELTVVGFSATVTI